MMKIVTNFAIAFVTLMLASFVGPHQSVMAADDLGPKKSSAQLTVDAGNIMIQQVPDSPDCVSTDAAERTHSRFHEQKCHQNSNPAPAES